MTKRKANLRTCKKNYYGHLYVLARHAINPLFFNGGTYNELHVRCTADTVDVTLRDTSTPVADRSKPVSAYMNFEFYRKRQGHQLQNDTIDYLVEQFRNGVIPVGMSKFSADRGDHLLV